MPRKRKETRSSGTTNSNVKDQQQREQQKTTLSISIDTNILNEIKRQAETKAVSLNSRINMISD
jgi:hypothetical protein